MGNGNSCTHEISFKPTCDKLNEEEKSVGFCTYSGPSGDKQRKDYCENLGAPGEYEYYKQGNDCYYNDCHPGRQADKDCCNGGCCSIKGNAAICRRKKFTGDPLTCCLNDQACNIADEYCFTDNKTCAPQYRNQASEGCKLVLEDYCTGANLAKNDTSWQNNWLGDNSICRRNIYRNLYSDVPAIACQKIILPQPGIPVNTEGYNYAQDLMDVMIKKYISQGGDLGSNESSEANINLNNTIYEMCNNTPGLCNKSLFNYCSTVTNNTLIRNPSYLKWCGCFMSPENYTKYTELYEINRECTPTCNMQGVIHLSNPDGTEFKTCSQTTCIIDDISINIANSTADKISFNQLCNSCAAATGGHCNCTITGGTFDIINSKTGNININEQCTGNSICYAESKNADGTLTNIRVPCTGDISMDKYEEIDKQSKKNYEDSIIYKNIIIFVVIIILFALLIVAYYLVDKYLINKKL